MCVSMYPQSLATFRAARTSLADPQAVENRARAFPASLPRPSAMLSTTLCAARFS